MTVLALRIKEWETPASNYLEEQNGNHRIGKFIYEKGFRSLCGIDGFHYFYATNSLTLTTLSEFRNNKWCMWMLDSPPDYRAMQKYAETAYGNVLTTGLGLGLVVHELCKNSKVTRITIVEQSLEVIALVKKYLPDDSRIEVCCDDFWHFVKHNSSEQDSLIVDLWVWRGYQKQLGIYKDEILPAHDLLRSKYPKAKIVFHSFAGMPTLEQIGAAERNGENAGELIYGLGKKETVK